LKSGLGVVQGH